MFDSVFTERVYYPDSCDIWVLGVESDAIRRHCSLDWAHRDAFDVGQCSAVYSQRESLTNQGISIVFGSATLLGSIKDTNVLSYANNNN